MKRRMLLILVMGLVLAPALGCDSDDPIMADDPQAPNQREKTREEQVAYLTKMLRFEDERKVRRAIHWLSEYASDAASAIPELEYVAQKHPSAPLQQAAQQAIAKIKMANAGP